jgi:hypothetical protein
MDFGLSGVVMTIASGTSAYLVEFAPVILLIAALALVFGIIERLIYIFFIDKGEGGDNINRTT